MVCRLMTIFDNICFVASGVPHFETIIWTKKHNNIFIWTNPIQMQSVQLKPSKTRLELSQLLKEDPGFLLAQPWASCKQYDICLKWSDTLWCYLLQIHLYQGHYMSCNVLQNSDLRRMNIAILNTYLLAFSFHRNRHNNSTKKTSQRITTTVSFHCPLPTPPHQHTRTEHHMILDISLPLSTPTLLYNLNCGSVSGKCPTFLVNRDMVCLFERHSW